MSLEKLQFLRTQRMEQSFIELQSRKKALEQWYDHANQQEQQLIAFQRWRLHQQETLFANLTHQYFDPQTLLDYRAKLEQLQQQEERLRADLTSTYHSLEIAKQQVQVAKQQSAQANIKLEKLKEIIKQEHFTKPRAESAQ